MFILDIYMLKHYYFYRLKMIESYNLNIEERGNYNETLGRTFHKRNESIGA